MIGGLFRTVFYIVAVWFIWRWLDRLVGRSTTGRFNATNANANGAKKSDRRADVSKEGEYIDFEEVKD